MKNTIIIVLIVLGSIAQDTNAQDLQQSQVPATIVTGFQQSFPKALDVDWEMDGNNYKVDFETGIPGTDHTVWYDTTGNRIRHKEEISKNDLPKNVRVTIDRDYGKYRIEDVKKITEGDKITYTLELKSLTEEWKVAFDSEGKELRKIAD